MGFFSNLFGKNKSPNTKNNEKEVTNATEKKLELVVLSPINGVVKFLSEVSDPVFAEEMTGKGVAIVPKIGEKIVKSPIKGKVKVAFPTGHAYGIATEEGPELLVHIGIDTVELDGKGFVKKVEVDNDIDAGMDLCDLDLEVIKENEKETDIIVIATNDSIVNFELELIVKNGAEVKIGEPIFKLNKK